MTTSRRTFIRAVSIAAAQLAGGASVRAFAEEPAGNIRFVVPLSAGSSVDVVARALIPKLSATLGRTMFADNRPGANSIIATQFVRNAKPDGNTVLLCTPAHAITRFLYPKQATYDPVNDFTLIGLAATNMNVLMVPIDSDVKSVRELIDKAKARPGLLNYGDSGGTAGGSAELLNRVAGIRTTNVLYRGAPEAINDTLAGRLDFIFSALSTGVPLIKGGKLRGLAVTGAQRHPSLPDLPTVAETVPGFEVLGWYGMVGPKGMPVGLVATLNKALGEAVQTDEVKKVLAANGFDAAPPAPPAQFTQFVTAELKKWGDVIKPLE